MVKRSGSIIAIFLAVMLSVPFTTGCSCSESKQEKETTTTGNETKEESTTTEETITLVSNIMNTYSTDFEREKALYESICLNCRYDYDSLETGLTREGQSAYGVLVEHKAVCGGYSTTFGIALTMMGIENELVIGMVSAGPHGWNKVCLEGEWYEVDVTWGDGTGDEYDYTYFNLTTDEMSLDHERRGIECNGTKYGQTYIKKLLREEYLADKVVIDTQEEALKYINEALNSGKTSIEMVFSNADVKNAVRELVKPDYWEEGERYKIYNIDKDSENYYFDFETLWDYGNEGIWYNKYTLEGIFRIDIFVTYLNDFREKENYFETLEEFYAYVRAEREKGMHEIKAYLAFTEDEINMMNMDTSQFGEGYYGAAYRTACDSDNMVEYTVYFMQ